MYSKETLFAGVPVSLERLIEVRDNADKPDAQPVGNH
jgi:hypothetical protein